VPPDLAHADRGSLLMVLSLRRSLLALALAVAASASAVGAAVVAHPSPGANAEPVPATVRDLPARPVVRTPKPTKGQRAARIALHALGIPYRWGGESPTNGFDCSGLVRWAYLGVGVDLPHSSYALYGEGRRVSRGRMRPGDVLFFEGLGHVGLYLGQGRMVHAPQTGRNVEIVRLARSNYGRRLIGARRVVSQ
jgi:peptidoglycan DL-endopeptidase CwlO